MNSPATPTTSANIDNVEQRIQGLMQNGGTAADYNALLQEAAGYFGQHSQARHDDVVTQILQGLTTATMSQNGGGLPAGFADKTAISYMNAAKMDISSEAAIPVARQIKAVINETAHGKARSIA